MRFIFAMKKKKMSSWNDEWVQLPLGECSFVFQWQPCQGAADVLVHVRSIRPMFPKCNNGDE